MATNGMEPRAAAQRLQMINGQLRTSDVTDLSVLTAFLEVPRERFVAPALAQLAYVDQDLPAAGADRRRLLAPRTLALLLQAAAIAPGERVLDVAGGSGYSAALLDCLGASVVAVESDRGAAQFAREALAGRAGVEVVEGELAAGAHGKGPFDVILVNGAFETTPRALLGQLATGGRLVGVDARTVSPRGVIIDKSSVGFSERSLFDARADVLEAFRRTPGFAF
jgi:protein-L-isoaspartate(D-aspartate) O-methyltransferase